MKCFADFVGNYNIYLIQFYNDIIQWIYLYNFSCVIRTEAKHLTW